MTIFFAQVHQRSQLLFSLYVKGHRKIIHVKTKNLLLVVHFLTLTEIAEIK